jgi:hypothetical protein
LSKRAYLDEDQCKVVWAELEKRVGPELCSLANPVDQFGLRNWEIVLVRKPTCSQDDWWKLNKALNDACKQAPDLQVLGKPIYAKMDESPDRQARGKALRVAEKTLEALKVVEASVRIDWKRAGFIYVQLLGATSLVASWNWKKKSIVWEREGLTASGFAADRVVEMFDNDMSS